jgi:membrane protein implicated in regulation of membrane protease activity
MEPESSWWIENAATLWLLAGAAMVALEVSLGMISIVLLFTGLAAIVVGASLLLGLVAFDSVLTQWSLFFAATAAWGAGLWKPLRQLRSRKSNEFNNMIGDKAKVLEGGIAPKQQGNIRWSGTVMKAELEETVTQSLPEGANVEIVSVKGTVATVRPV